MRRNRHCVEWHGVGYTAVPLSSHPTGSALPPVWAISRGKEFIGTLPMRPEETTKEFEARCATWLGELLGPSEARDEPNSRRRGFMRSAREASLRPQFAGLYPYLTPGQWEPAAVLSDRILAHVLGRTGGRFITSDRALDPAHFEFRGGHSRPPHPVRRRREGQTPS